MSSRPLWTPSHARAAAAQITDFRKYAAGHVGRDLPDYGALWQWSVDDVEGFWSLFWDWAKPVGERGRRVLADGDRMPGARFFPDAKINYAENCLLRRDDGDALVFRGEDQVHRRMSHGALYDAVSRFSQFLWDEGVRPGVRVAAYMPNMPETIVAMLATAAIGAIWSSASPDFGVQGVLDRFGQIEPKVLIAADGYFYNGKRFDSIDKVKDILTGLPSVHKAVIVPYTTPRPDLSPLRPDAVVWDDAVAPYEADDIAFDRGPFDRPLFIMFSSGTTGAPKCIVHNTGGPLLMHLKDHRLHCDVREGDRVFYFTTCGWMMWNWLVTGLAAGATLLLYDGSPFHPSGNALFDFADEEGMTFFGTSAKYLDALAKQGYRPKDTHRLDTLRGLGSTGSPLVVEGFEYVYDAIKSDLHLTSLSGGTDLLGVFVLGDPAGPVYPGEIQRRGLGLAVDCRDETGTPLPPGNKGELVCTRPFPSMPVGFWGDEDGKRYHAAYYERFPGVWHHGDFIEITEHDGVIIHGRSDATLNPGGVRIGTSEIYRQVEKLDEVLESLVIGQDWDGDTRVVLFVKLREGASLDEDLEKRIKATIRAGASPRHVPAKIVAVTDIPRTKSGKIVELAVRDIVHGRQIKNKEALANPEALEQFRDRPELAS
ncbi:MAG: acetoacetate--CoA ligase [Azospirillaceae bacterium]